MKKVVFGAVFFLIMSFSTVPAIAAVDVSIGISLPPLIAFPAPPHVIVLPDADDVYVIPGIDVDIFFWNGWWWRPWQGRWYRSHYYDRGWVYYSAVPRFYFDVDPGWRRYYIERSWYGHHWYYERIPHQRLQQNWKTWRNNRYWEKKKTWDVRNYNPRTQQQRYELRDQRQKQYQQRPEIQRQQQQEMRYKQQKEIQQKREIQQQQQIQIQQQQKQRQELKHEQQRQIQQKQDIQRRQQQEIRHPQQKQIQQGPEFQQQQQQQEIKYQQQRQYQQRQDIQRQQHQQQQGKGAHPQQQQKSKEND
ncbi:MAG: hypothetical protein ABFD75_13820 [Smithella sp.]